MRLMEPTFGEIDIPLSLMMTAAARRARVVDRPYSLVAVCRRESRSSAVLRHGIRTAEKAGASPCGMTGAEWGARCA
jgi:hypothetical protein